MALKSKEKLRAEPSRSELFTKAIHVHSLGSLRKARGTWTLLSRWKDGSHRWWLITGLSLIYYHYFSLKQLVIGSTTALCSKRGQLLPLAHSFSYKWPRPSPEVRVIHYFATSRLGCSDAFRIWKSVEHGRQHQLTCDFHARLSLLHRVS